MDHRFDLSVYYEDTDLAGIVYYANYLKFIERARSEWVQTLGIDQMRLKAEHGVVFAVRRIEADYLLAAKFGDRLQVNTRVLDVTGARMRLEQTVQRGQERLFDAIVTLIALTESGKATRLPAEFRLKLNKNL
ncbi:MAG: tol-pal system-associated acyl-CoA thioesterase [Paracoccaceae bacterium]|nr:tol-pal system-associated acyl-CoA thioesterase [Marinovum sp.]MBT6099764.1 tol-pal system-associated acyl-CoA thioesterase [Marinovum sp.]MDG1423898.1 tol-pal system-associated acyl-CoA thioesterase [Paracoccaceae bacterium]